jgi:putative ABC transport system permease protein
MFRYTVRSVLAHKTRLLLTAAAIVVGVGMVAGAFILNDTAGAAGDEPVGTAHRADATVRAVQGGEGEIFSDETGEFFPGPPIPASVVDRVARIDGVAAATGVVAGDAQLIGRNGRVISGRAPLGRSVDGSFAADLHAGRVPAAPGEIVVDRATADEHGFGVGDRVRVIASGAEPRTVTIAGVLESPEFTDAVVLVGFDPATARRLLAPPGTVGYIEVHAAAGVGEQALRDRVAAGLGPGYQVFTGATLAAERTKPDSLISQILFIASAVALFAGSFLIRNTFSIVLAGRTRELALLRCVGAGRGQLRRAILLESAIVGALAAGLGLVLGVGIAWVLGGLLHSGGAIVADVTGSAPRILPRTVAIALAVGVLTAVVSAWAPARRVTRVPPVAALRGEVFSLDRRTGRVRAAVGALATAAGVGAVLAGVLSEPVESSYLQAGAVAAAAGVLVLAPVLARALAHLLGAPLARVTVAGELARGNAVRSPRRAAATMLPLVIGLALMGFLATLAAGTKASSVGTFDRTIRADFHLAAAGGGMHRPRMSPAAVDRLAGVPELAAVAAFRDTTATVAGRADFVTAADPAQVRAVVTAEVTDGDMSRLAAGGIAVSRSAADAHRLAIGSPVTVRTPRGERTFIVRAVYDLGGMGDFGRVPFGDYLIAAADYPALAADPGVSEVYAAARPGIAPGAARAAVERAVAGYPNVEIADRGELRRAVASEIDPALRVYYSLFGLVMLIALFGIGNTLVLSIVERVREIGLLRVVGMDRRQVRSMIRWEAIIIAAAGAAIGVGLGTFLGWATTIALDLPVAAVPAGLLAAFTAGAMAASVLAAGLPARRAARTGMLRAVAAE